MKIIGVYNIKGGVGKTAAAVNFSYLAAEEGKKTLLCDFDPQAAATFYFKVNDSESSSKHLLKGKSDLTEMIRETEYENLDILPADFSYRNLDIMLDDLNNSKKKLDSLLRPLKDDYDFVFIDCPPSISLVSENIFNAVDFLLVPTVPTTLSLRTYDEIINFFEKSKLDSGMIIPFFSMVERRKNMHLESMDSFSKTAKRVCKNYIPYQSDVEKMGIHQEPVCYTKPNSIASRSFKLVWSEIKRKIAPKK